MCLYKFGISVLLFAQITLVSAAPKLITTDWLAKNLAQTNMVLVDMSDTLQYQRFHIPGAVNLPYDYLTEKKHKISLSIGAQKLRLVLGQLGINRDAYVVAYDDTGGLHASRLLWELEQLGHKQMALLDGGLVKWIRDGHKVSHRAPTPNQTTYSNAKQTVNRTAVTKDVAPATRDKNTLIIDVRTPEEYVGHPKYPRSGHIPGAKFWQWDQALDIEGGFTLHDGKDLKQEMQKLGLSDPKQPVVVYCRSGHRAAHTYITLRTLGFENVKLYDGSMLDYEQQKSLPLTIGQQP